MPSSAMSASPSRRSAVVLAVLLRLAAAGGRQGANITSVLLMRHCARSVPEKSIYESPSLEYFSNYSQVPWLPFSVPDMECTAQGRVLVEREGAWLKSHGALPLPVHVIADDCERDRTTGQMLLQGMDLAEGESTYSVDAAPFESGEGRPGCEPFSLDEYATAITAQLSRSAEVPAFHQIYSEMLEVAGLGVAGNWTTGACELDPRAPEHPWAPVGGACEVAHAFAERFLMEWAAGQPVGWGKSSEVLAALPRWQALSVWYLNVTLYAPELQRRIVAPMAASILRVLEAGEQGTTAFVGHDTNQGGLSSALGLHWDASPWPMDVTLPGAYLRFDREEGSDEVSLSYVFPDDFSSTATGSTRSVPAGFPDAPLGKVSLGALREIVESGTDAACRARRGEVSRQLRQDVMV